MTRDRIEEYDEGYDSKESFERAGADQPEHVEPVEESKSIWSAWHRNPFTAIGEIATQEDYDKAVSELKLAAGAWLEWDCETFVDDLLCEVAGATNIVCQSDTINGAIQWRAAYDTPTGKKS